MREREGTRAHTHTGTRTRLGLGLNLTLIRIGEQEQNLHEFGLRYGFIQLDLLLTLFSLLFVVHVLIVTVGTHHYEEGNYKHVSVGSRYEVAVPIQPYAAHKEKK